MNPWLVHRYIAEYLRHCNHDIVVLQVLHASRDSIPCLLAFQKFSDGTVEAGDKSQIPVSKEGLGAQEIWVSEDAQFLSRNGAKGSLRYCHHFKSGVFGSGLLLMSAFPICEVG